MKIIDITWTDPKVSVPETSWKELPQLSCGNTSSKNTYENKEIMIKVIISLSVRYRLVVYIYKMICI